MECSHGQGKGGCGRFHRRFFTKEEKLAKLEAYAQELKAELKVVEGIIQKIKEDKEGM